MRLQCSTMTLTMIALVHAAGQTRVDVRTQIKGVDVVGHVAETAAPHTVAGVSAAAKQGNGTKFQMAGSEAWQNRQVAVYDRDGNMVAANCSISEGALSCGNGTKMSTLWLGELVTNGHHGFVIHGAATQEADGCIVLSGQPGSAEVLRATGSTVTDDNGRTCVVMEWSRIEGGGITNLNQIATRNYSDLQGIPSSFIPTAHASSHQQGGSDEVAVSIPAAGAIPKAGADGRLNWNWLPVPGSTTRGAVMSRDCSLTNQFVQSINTDASITCGTPPSGGAGGGAVSSVGLEMPKGFTVSGSPVTSSGTLRAAYSELGADYFVQEGFAGGAGNISGVSFGQAGIYAQQHANGTGTLSAIRADEMSGVWQIASGGTSGNDSLFYFRSETGMPEVSATEYSYETRIALVTTTDSTLATGLFDNTSGKSFDATGSIVCYVVNGASPGTWSCALRRWGSGAWQVTTLTMAPAKVADTSPHRIKFVVTSSQVDVYFDSSKVGCFNATGNSGCTAGLTLTTAVLMPFWEARTATNAPAKMNVDGWRAMR